MTLIVCNYDCKYQKDGYCNLKSCNSYVNNTNSDIDCIHYVKKENLEKNTPQFIHQFNLKP